MCEKNTSGTLPNPVFKAELVYMRKLDVQLLKGLVSTCVIYVYMLCSSFESQAVNTSTTAPHPFLPVCNVSILRIGHHLRLIEELLIKRSDADI